MKSLYNYILESIQDMRLFIKNEIDNVDDETVKKIVALMNKVGSIDETKIITYMTERGIEDVWKHIIRILRDDENDYSNFVKLINGELKVPAGEDLVKGNNIYKLFDGLFSKSTLEELCAFKQAKNSITRGAGEVLCRLLISNANDKKKGDFVFDNKVVEFKSNGGRVMSPKIKPVEYMNRATEDLLDIKLSTDYKELNRLGIFANKTNIDTWFNLIQKSDVDLVDALVIVLTSQFESNKIDKQLKELIKQNISSLEKPGKEHYDILIRLLGSVQLYFYHEEEHFDYFLVGSESSKGKHDLDNYVCLDNNTLSDIKSIYDSKEIYYQSKPRIGSPQDKAVRVFNR